MVFLALFKITTVMGIFDVLIGAFKTDNMIDTRFEPAQLFLITIAAK